MYKHSKEIKIKNGSYKLSAKLSDEIKNSGYISIDKKFSFVDYKNDSKLKDEEYKLIVDEKNITVFSKNSIGFLYANNTIKELLKNDVIECVEINDYPDIKIRSVMLDVSRTRMYTIKELKKLIDLFSVLRFNQLQLYFEVAFAYKEHKKVYEDIAVYTADEIIEIKEYCKKYAIELVPNQNCLGHLERFLMHKEYFHLAEYQNGGGMRYYDMSIARDFVPSNTIAVSNDEAFKFIISLLDELLPNFDSEYVNVGCDEPWEFGASVSKKLCDEKGKDNVYIDYLNRIAKYVKSKNKTMMFWADIIQEYPERVGDIDKDAIALVWGYAKEQPTDKVLEIFKKTGMKFYTCLGTAAWLSISGRYDTAYENIANGAKKTIKYGASGAMITNWGDRGHHEQPIISIPSYILAGCCFWNTNADVDIVDELSKLYFHDEDLSSSKMLMDIVNLSGEYKLSNAWTPWGLSMQETVKKLFSKDLEYFKNGDFDGAKKRIEDLRKNIDNIKAGRDDFELIKEQMIFTLDFTYSLIDYSKSLILSKTMQSEDLDITIRDSAKKNMEAIESRYKKLWLATSKEGGLKESAEYFTRL